MINLIRDVRWLHCGSAVRRERRSLLGEIKTLKTERK